MINSQNLIDKICALISAGGLSSLQSCQATGALDILSNSVISVASFVNLPNATTYAGRLVYVNDENRYYHAVDGYWLNNLNTKIFNFGPQPWAWGCGSVGRLGDNTTTDRSSPVSVVGGFTDWCQFSAGAGHSLGVRCNGTAWAWGTATSGRLGDDSIVSKSSPVSVIGGFTDWCVVNAGSEHSLGVRQNGTAWAWGAGSDGRLGHGTTINTSSPVSVVGGFTDWYRVSAGCQHSLGVRRNGTAWAWGAGTCGRLGDNTTTDRSSPVSVVGGFTDWCQLSAGICHSLGVRQNGSAWAWGYNSLGRLGDNTVVAKSSPVSVVGGFTDWCQVSAGACHSLGVRQNGTAWAWGGSALGQLGDNTIVSKSSPVSVVGGFTDWCQVSAGSTHSLGVRKNGSAWAWGQGACGFLGTNSVVTCNSPVSVAGGLTGWCQVSAGCAHSLAINQAQKGF
jgi:alpha-tubulin suppressor-like RCC1 family protein